MIEALLERFLEKRQICTDTRKVQTGDLFFALKGDRFDGNQYAAQALDQGADYAVVDDPSVVKDDRYLLVDNGLEALQQLATAYRRTLPAVVIGLTGSNGKTTTKELMHAVLSKKFRTQATIGNLNNHIGVPLTLLSIHPDSEMAIIEMGANHQKEIALLASIAEPDYGLITNIGQAHLEGFGGIEGVRKGKGELFDYIRETKGTVFVNTELDPLPEMAEGIETISFNTSADDLNFSSIGSGLELEFSWQFGQELFEVHSAMTGEYNLPNFAVAIAVGSYFQVEPQSISDALSDYVPANQRSQIVQTSANQLILDAYNANPTSMEAALRNLSEAEGKRWFIIGDMLELGEASSFEHQRIATLATSLGLEGWLVGPEFGKLDTAYTQFSDVHAVIEHLKKERLSNHLVLIKGSRGIRLEEVVDSL